MLTGRCLCGAVRWSSEAVPKTVHHCHCTMCRRWTGAAFATLVWFARRDVHWTGDPPHCFRSSPIALRRHCGRCGTALALAYDARDDIAMAAGTLDHPEQVLPTHHYGIEARLPWADVGATLPGRSTKESW
jgi:hypothetical protein